MSHLWKGLETTTAYYSSRDLIYEVNHRFPPIVPPRREVNVEKNGASGTVQETPEISAREPLRFFKNLPGELEDRTTKCVGLAPAASTTHVLQGSWQDPPADIDPAT